MRHGDERTGECHQRLLHRLACRDVKMVRRLVQYEKVRVRQHEFEECHTRLFPARECADEPQYIIPVKEECPEIVACRLLIQTVSVANLIQDGLRGIQPLMLL